MSFNIGSYVIQQYIGVLAGMPVKLCTTGGPNGHQSKAMFAKFDWLNVYKTGGVNINLQSPGQAVNQLDKILMVYVDNTNNSLPVYVYFQDTQFNIACPAGYAGFFPTLTNGFNCQIYNGQAGVGGGSTTIQFCNFLVDNLQTAILNQAVALELTQSQPGDTFPNFSTPVLGTFSFETFVSLASSNSVAVFAAVAGGLGVFAVTSYEVALISVYTTGNPVLMEVTLEDNLGNTIWIWQFYAMAQIDGNYPRYLLANRTGLQAYLRADRSYVLRNYNPASSGFAILTLEYNYTIL